MKTHYDASIILDVNLAVPFMFPDLIDLDASGWICVKYLSN